MGQISLLIWSWIETTRNVIRGRIWGPFILYAIVQWLAILLFVSFYRSWLAPVMVPLVKWMSGAIALHYPIFYLALPGIFSRVTTFLDLFFGAWLIGAGFLLFWQADRPADPGRPALRVAGRAYGRLLMVRLPVTIGVLVLLTWLPQAIAGSSGDVPAMTQRLLRYGTLLVGAILEALVLYAPLAVLVEGRGIGGALKRSVGIAARTPVATLGAVLFPSLIQVPVSAVFRRSETIVRNMSPEVIAWLIAGAVVLYMIATFYIVGAGARLFRAQTESARG